MTRSYWLLVALAALACSSAQRGPPPAQPAATVAAAERDLAREDAALDAIDVTGDEERPVDCPRARALRENICTLSEKICAVIAGDGTVPDGAQRCQRTRLRCRSARARVDAACADT